MSQKIVLGIGNPLGGDDDIGPHVARRLQKRVKEVRRQDIIAIDAGSAPEGYTSVIRQHRPEQLVLVDATDIGLPPGSIRLLSPDKIKTVSFSTHSMPLSALISYVQEFCGQVYTIGIQPAQTEIGNRLSEPVHKSGERVAELILDNRLDEISVLE
jgi:hydrogenase 3 maturation protease